MQINANSMQSISSWMNNSASNVANVNTKDYGSIRTDINNNGGSITAEASQTNKQTDLAKEMTDQIQIEKTLDANVQAVKTEDKMIGSLLDLTI